MGTARPSVAAGTPARLEVANWNEPRAGGRKLEAGSFRIQPVSVVACQRAPWCTSSLVGIMEQLKTGSESHPSSGTRLSFSLTAVGHCKRINNCRAHISPIPVSGSTGRLPSFHSHPGTQGILRTSLLRNRGPARSSNTTATPMPGGSACWPNFLPRCLHFSIFCSTCCALSSQGG